MLRRRAVEEEKDARLGLTEMSGALPGRLRLSAEIVAQAQPERAQPADAQKLPARQTVAQAARRAEEAEHEGVPNARLCSIVPIPGRKEIEICVAATQYSSRDEFSRVKSLLHKAKSKCVARDADTHPPARRIGRSARRIQRRVPHFRSVANQIRRRRGASDEFDESYGSSRTGNPIRYLALPRI